uniref:Secreted protein n=1 Tax=Trichuris muris TaxID=70415 RepID=A0A5S6Q556_TRIMR
MLLEEKNKRPFLNIMVITFVSNTANIALSQEHHVKPMGHRQHSNIVSRNWTTVRVLQSPLTKVGFHHHNEKHESTGL